jgi:malate dehydrogenase (oxaloacetate-decarboxylating)(NADP+)
MISTGRLCYPQALLNALELAEKEIKNVKIVISGAGSAALACTKICMFFFCVNPDNIIMFDKGVLSSTRTDLSAFTAKKIFKR